VVDDSLVKITSKILAARAKKKLPSLSKYQMALEKNGTERILFKGMEDSRQSADTQNWFGCVTMNVENGYGSIERTPMIKIIDDDCPTLSAYVRWSYGNTINLFSKGVEEHRFSKKKWTEGSSKEIH
jgi:hypothetical protein